MSKSNTLIILGLALTLAGGALSFAGPASAQAGAYTDSSPNVRASLEREHFFILGHTDAVQQSSAANRRAAAAQAAAPFYASTDPVFVGKDLSIRSQR
jgi:hypothetical protein